MSPLDFRLITASTLGSVRILSMLNRNYHKPTICLCVSHVSDLKDEVKEKAIKLLSPDNNIIQDINVNGNDVTIVTTTPLGAVEFKAALGEESMQSAVDGSPLKVTYTLDGERLVEKQKGSYESVNVRSLEEGKLVMRLTAGNGVVAVRKYDKA